jgi:hypothetical protein
MAKQGARLWSTCVPGLVPGHMVRIELHEDPANVEDSEAVIEVTGPITVWGERTEVGPVVARCVMPLAEFRRLAAMVVGWPGVTRG